MPPAVLNESSFRAKEESYMPTTTTTNYNNNTNDHHCHHFNYTTTVNRRWKMDYSTTNRSMVSVLFLFLVSSWCVSSGIVAAKSLNGHNINELDVPDHLDGVKLEQDGHLNTRFRQEIIMGDLEELDELPYEERRAKLDEVFEKADTNNDNYLETSELEIWIQRKLEEHLDEAVNETEAMFRYLDTNGNGFVEWAEYFRKFLEARDYDEKMIQNYLLTMGGLDFNETMLEYIPLKNPQDKVILMRYQGRWFDADETTQDNKLTKEEFLTFRHPEHRDNSMQELAESIIENLDKNRDEKLTVDEFIALPPGIVSEKEARDDQNWQADRKTEFENYIDSNKDGFVNVVELKHYMNPRNPKQIENEAEAIMELIDDDHDQKLSKTEVLRHEDEFISSKMVEIAKNFHDEF
ncbi:45 kDa calcium-binding protein-like [Argonauta hians]